MIIMDTQSIYNMHHFSLFRKLKGFQASVHDECIPSFCNQNI